MKRQPIVIACLIMLFLGAFSLNYGQTYAQQSYVFPINRTFHGGPWGEFFDLIQELGQVFSLTPGTKLTISLNLQIAPTGFGFATGSNSLTTAASLIMASRTALAIPRHPAQTRPPKNGPPPRRGLPRMAAAAKSAFIFTGDPRPQPIIKSAAL